ncbi:MAG TPA: hypothetical protein GX523_17220 [Desulfitobacterium dehalogenans]|uniref:Uncharacterized protein n=1 Tax=Desulfitobacterium dehalogenans TaxID=36854 RepID=A0A7C6Z6Q5_9FIRM|nr:hypothetical protein [Desulfitobacterium dehalogenans]
MLKKKFILEFDEEPSLLFVQEKGKRHPTVYQDGEMVQGIRSIDISSSIDNITIHRIEFATGATKR